MLISEAIPGTIRQADHFLDFFQRFINFLSCKLRTSHVSFETPIHFLKECANMVGILRHPLRFCSERMQSILHNLEISDLSNYQSLLQMANFATMVATYIDGINLNSTSLVSWFSGFSIIIEPYDERTPTIAFPVLHFICNNSALAIKPVFARFNTVIITSGVNFTFNSNFQSHFNDFYLQHDLFYFYWIFNHIFLLGLRRNLHSCWVMSVINSSISCLERPSVIQMTISDVFR